MPLRLPGGGKIRGVNEREGPERLVHVGLLWGDHRQHETPLAEVRRRVEASVADPKNMWDQAAVSKYRRQYREGGERAWGWLPQVSHRPAGSYRGHLVDDGSHRVAAAILEGATHVLTNYHLEAPEGYSHPGVLPAPPPAESKSLRCAECGREL